MSLIQALMYENLHMKKYNDENTTFKEMTWLCGKSIVLCKIVPPCGGVGRKVDLRVGWSKSAEKPKCVGLPKTAEKLKIVGLPNLAEVGQRAKEWSVCRRTESGVN